MPTACKLATQVGERLLERNPLFEYFFSREAPRLAEACREMSERFLRGGRLLAFGRGPYATDAQHVSVEFVHPVIVGKRALPAVHVEGADVSGSLRLLSRPGDVLLAVSSASDARTSDLLQRAEAWGLTRLWLGAGARPPVGRAEHVVWLEDIDPAIAARSGDVVLLYHLLWELTHVVFEHPGLLEAASDCTDDVCITCSDEGRLGEVVGVRPDGQAEIRTPSGLETIDTTLIGDACPGDLVLVHAGAALCLVMKEAG